MKTFLFFLLATIPIFSKIIAQPLSSKTTITHADTLRGTYGPSRDWWDALKYNLHVNFNIKDSTISGYNTIDFKILKHGTTMQIDLQQPLVLDSIKFGPVKYENQKNE